ncbi:Hint domain-containing protein [Aeromonas hydrophila]|uniref:Hint domain-containing protein n=1 Tax=Aeromonas hydrophila TaxID=644 RepID=UPI00214DC8B6|nr:Hint domain-containing protein [Aeromonas hydrophila]MCR3903059.1 Hint domain-containing protein [Aeromonas hydrophila]
MLLPAFKPSQRRLLVGSAIALALFATPLSYDFSHHQWQLNQAYAKSCFVAGTRILMADGEDRPIETLRVGERVRDQYGHSNQILAVERVLLGARRLYGLNRLAPFFTAEHPLLTTRGWAAIAPAMTRTENPTLAVLPLFTGMHLLGWSEHGSAGNLALAPHPAPLLVESLCWLDAPPTTALFNLILDGSHSYVANGLIVHNKDGDGSGNGGGGSSGGGGSGSSSGGSDSDGGGGSDSDGGGSSGGGSDSDGGSSSGGSSHDGGSDSSHGGDDHGGGEHAGGEQHAGGDRHAGGEQHGGGDRHAGGDRHGGGRGLGNGLDDNGVDAVDANGNEIRGDGTVDDNGVDAVDANGNEIRGDGTVDDNGVDAVNASGNEIRGDGTVDDKGVDAVDASGNEIRGDGTVDDRGQTLTDAQEQALIQQGFNSKVQP